ncbi:1647_t:CDS:2 [Scutellospora calospora]|uniref:1647_t:CDS:1 n=1 Tax=Scutellospora calospora TaxID=85575 RepID=A0ACA9LKY8_9GLOM|nr:1647_t:CDS:2 [Scutellospora calospora]
MLKSFFDNVFSIYLVFQQHGSIGQFDFITLLTNIVASFALFKVAEILTEITMIAFFEDSKGYKYHVFDPKNV